MKILGIETSCDETSVSIVVEDSLRTKKILSNIVSSQIRIHKKYGGVLPELASRKHLENLPFIFDKALEKANINIKDIDLISVTTGPGLIVALLIGISFAKGLALVLNKPIIGVNHISAHIYTNHINHNLKFPYLALVISGGHTILAKVKDFTEYQIIGSTQDDAIGEAFDKVSKALNLGYPGGPQIDKLAKKGTPNIKFTKAKIKKNPYDFSFSGIKTEIINYIKENPNFNLYNLCASFQKIAFEMIFDKINLYLRNNKNIDTLSVSGGVARNSYFRKEIYKIPVKNIFIPPLKLCTDNGAIIASYAYHLFKKGKINNLSLDGFSRKQFRKTLMNSTSLFL